MAGHPHLLQKQCSVFLYENQIYLVKVLLHVKAWEVYISKTVL